jgi:hypothetical protein
VTSKAVQLHSHLWDFSQGRRLASQTVAIGTDHHAASVYAYLHGQAYTRLSLQARGQRAEVLHNLQARPHCPVRIVFMGVGIAKVHQQPMARRRPQVPIETPYDLGTHLVRVLQHAGKICRINRLFLGRSDGNRAIQHGKLAPFSRRGLQLCSRRRGVHQGGGLSRCLDMVWRTLGKAFCYGANETIAPAVDGFDEALHTSAVPQGFARRHDAVEER